MLIVLGLSHIHCLPGVVYIRIMRMVERRGLNKVNDEEYYVDHIHGYLRLDLTSDVNCDTLSQRTGYVHLFAPKLTNTTN